MEGGIGLARGPGQAAGQQDAGGEILEPPGEMAGSEQMAVADDRDVEGAGELLPGPPQAAGHALVA